MDAFKSSNPIEAARTSPLRHRSAGSRAHGVVAFAIVLALPVSIRAADDAAKCVAGKQKLSAKYLVCIDKAERSLAIGGTEEEYAADVAACDERIEGAWVALESNTDGSCPSLDDEEAFLGYLYGCIGALTRGLSEGSMPADPVTCSLTVPQCEASLLGCQSGGPALILETGQTECYGPDDLVVPCAGTGQDGERQAAAVPSFMDNGDGTVSDTTTGLMWEKLSASDPPADGGIHDFQSLYTWDQALAKVEALNATAYAGHSDWRIPDFVELLSLADPGHHDPAVAPAFNDNCTPGCSIASCSCTGIENFYWSSSLWNVNVDTLPMARMVHFRTGEAQPWQPRIRPGLPNVFDGYLRAVRTLS